MKKYKEVVNVTKSMVQDGSTTCDLCKKPILQEPYSAENVEICHRTGENYPDNGGGEDHSVDMCAECFTTKLTPWLKEQGAEITTTSWEW